MARRCSRPGCKQDAVYTLTYVYRDSTAVVGPLAAYTEPHCYDLCESHAGRLTAPLGWDVVRLPVQAEEPPLPPPPDDLEALANAVREAAPGGPAWPPARPPFVPERAGRALSRTGPGGRPDR